MVVCSSLYIDGNNPGCYAWLGRQYQQLAGAIFSVIQEHKHVQQHTEGILCISPSFPLCITRMLKRAKLKGQDHQGSQILIGQD